MTEQENNTTVSEQYQGSSPLFQFWLLVTRAHPNVKEIGNRRRAQLIAVLSLVILVINSLGILFVPTERISPTEVIILWILNAFFLISYILSRTTYFSVGAYLLSISFSLSGYALALSGDGQISASLYSTIPVALALGSVSLPWIGLTVVILLNLISTSLLPFIINSSNYSFTQASADVGTFLTIGSMLLIGVVFRDYVERQRLKEIFLSNQELAEIKSQLETRVEERDAESLQKEKELADQVQKTEKQINQLQAVSALSNTISTYNELSSLLPRVASLIAERFDFYHVGIFLIDSKNEYAVLSGTNSDGGYKMLERGHRLRVGEEGIVGRAASSGEARIVSDTESDPIFFKNMDLPETRAEAAIPLRFGNQIIGILDMQSPKINAFEDDDIGVLTALANQVAIAISNVRALEDARRFIDQANSLNREYTASSWRNIIHRREKIGVRYTGANLEDLMQPVSNPEIKSALQNGNIETSLNATALPIVLRGEIIGTIHVRVPHNHKWTPDERDILKSVSDRVAFALENARLVEDAQARAEQERALAEMGNKINSSFRFDSILRTAAEELSRALNGSEVLVQMTSEQDTKE